MGLHMHAQQEANLRTVHSFDKDFFRLTFLFSFALCVDFTFSFSLALLVSGASGAATFKLSPLISITLDSVFWSWFFLIFPFLSTS